MQPVHLFVGPGPQERALLTEHFGVALEAVLHVHGVQRIAPGKVSAASSLASVASNRDRILNRCDSDNLLRSASSCANKSA